MTTNNADDNGVPILTTDDIELKAEEVISYFDRTVLDIPQRTPLLEIIKELNKKYNVAFNCSLPLGATKYGNIILGKTQLKPKGIFVDVSLINDPRFHFILAHELGHLILHRFVDIKKTGYEEQELVDTEIDFVTGKKNLKTARDWIEWQANYFASAILIPRATVIQAVIEKQKEMDIKRNIGQIILEPKQYSVSDYKEIQKQLVLIYNVNATNIEYRLKELGILIDRMNLNVKHVSEFFATEG
ncbi:MAG: ImmA/IrrE family metallo-endopeptidase [Sedimentisphaerales bacterium]|jgi:Zn-dependent peptidase ImmA (M78 family)